MKFEDKRTFKVCNIIFDNQIPTTHKQGESKELILNSRDLYLITEVRPVTLRVTNLISGAQRTIPHNLAVNLSLQDMQNIRFALAHEHLTSKLGKLYHPIGLSDQMTLSDG